MKNSALLLALAGLALTASPSHAFIQVPVTVGPSFTATLTNLTNAPDGTGAYITGTGPNGTFNLGQLSYFPSLGQLYVFNGTGISTDPSSTNYFTDPNYNILTEVDLANLSLTETFSGGSTTNAPLYGDFAGLDQTTITNFLELGGTYLATAPLPAGATLVSATLTGQFSDGTNPIGRNQQMYVAAVPETNTNILLLVGLALAALPVLSAHIRAGRRSQ